MKTEIKKIMERLGTKTQYRSMAAAEVSAVDEEARTARFSISSEEPYERQFGIEVLDHSKGSVRTGRMKNRAPFLCDHNWTKQPGVIEQYSIDEDRKARILTQFGRTALAKDVMLDLVDGIKTKVSVGYIVHEMVLEKEVKDGPNVYRVTDWEPVEVSLVSVPADDTVGLGRSLEDTPQADMEVRNMKDNQNTDAPVVPEVDVKAAQKEARDEERDRVRNILAIGAKFDMNEEAKKAVANGTPLNEFHKEFMDKWEPPKVKDAEIGMSDKDVREFRLMRLVNAMAHPNDRGKQEAAAFEFDCCSVAADKREKAPEGMALPADFILRGLTTQQTRDITAGSGGTGQYLVDDKLMPMIAALENALLLKKMGAQVFTGLQGDVSFPREGAGATAYWVGEASDATESTPTFEQVTMTGKTVGATSDLTRKMLLNSAIDIENWLRGNLMLKLAIEGDRVGIAGSGSAHQPQGILNTTGIGSVALAANGDQVTYAALVKLEGAVAVDNALVGNCKFLTNNVVRQTMRSVPEHATAAPSRWIYESKGSDIGEVLGYECYVTGNVPSDLTKGSASEVCSAAIFGDFSKLYLGYWSGVDINVDTSTFAKAGGVRVVALQDMDVALAHPESFAAIQDILADA